MVSADPVSDQEIVEFVN